MSDVSIDPRFVRMPDFGEGEWLNTAQPLERTKLRGRVLLIDFWDFVCLNCIRTFPYLTNWYKRYVDKGLTIIGVHTPEFKFGHLRRQIEAAISEFELRYPILLDNHYETWSRFANKVWPTKYLVDSEGYVRYQHQGAGRYREIEQVIQRLLRQRDSRLSLPDPLPPLRAEDAPGVVSQPHAPALYAGYQGGGLFGGALGNPEGYVTGSPMFYELPEQRQEGQFFVEGVWRAWPESLAYAGQEGGKIFLPYTASSVNGVLSPSADPVELALDLRPTEADPIVIVKQDGHFLTSSNAGSHISFMDDGTSFLRIDRPRSYQIVRNQGHATHELEFTFYASGLALFAFSFTSGPKTRADER